MNTWIERTAWQRALRVFVVCLLLTVGTVALYPLNADYWRPFFHGPTTVDAAMLEAQAPLGTPITTPFVTVAGTRVLDSGVQEVTTEEGIYKHVTAGYYALVVPDAEGGRKALIVKSSKPISTTVTGTLSAMPYDLDQTLFQDDTDGSRRSAVYPLLLDIASYRETGYMAVFWGLLFLGILWFFGIRAVQRLLDIRRHPAVARAAKWGDLAATSAEVERELRFSVKYRRQGFRFTENYLVRPGPLAFELLRFEDLVWVYKKATRRSVNLIPIGTYHTVELRFADGSASIAASQRKVDEMIALVLERTPWVIVGFTDQLDQLYRKQRGEFVAYVQEQRRTPPPPPSI